MITSNVVILQVFLFIFVVLKLINLRTFDSFNLAMTIISSGGFLPVNEIDTINKVISKLNKSVTDDVVRVMMLFSRVPRPLIVFDNQNHSKN